MSDEISLDNYDKTEWLVTEESKETLFHFKGFEPVTIDLKKGDATRACLLMGPSPFKILDYKHEVKRNDGSFETFDLMRNNKPKPKKFTEEVYSLDSLQHTDTLWAQDEEEALKLSKQNSEDVFPGNDFVHVIKPYEVSK